METYRAYTAELIDQMYIERFFQLLPSMDDTTKGGVVSDLQEAFRRARGD